MKSFLYKHRMAVGCTGAILALVVAGIYYFVVPQEADGAGFIPKIILLYGHSLCWVFLSVASLLWGLSKAGVLAGRAMYAALATYAIFMATLLLTK